MEDGDTDIKRQSVQSITAQNYFLVEKNDKQFITNKLIQ